MEMSDGLGIATTTTITIIDTVDTVDTAAQPTCTTNGYRTPLEITKNVILFIVIVVDLATGFRAISEFVYFTKALQKHKRQIIDVSVWVWRGGYIGEIVVLCIQLVHIIVNVV